MTSAYVHEAKYHRETWERLGGVFSIRCDRCGAPWDSDPQYRTHDAAAQVAKRHACDPRAVADRAADS